MLPVRPKITDLYENKVLTRTQRDEYGQWQQVQQEMRYKRPVNDLSAGMRFVNFVVDLSAVSFLSGFIDDIDFITDMIPFSGLLVLPLLPLYYFLCEFSFQQTLGKLFTSSVVVDEYGEKPEIATIFLRSIIRCIPFESFSFLFSNRGWHDKWSNTYVMKKSEVEHIKMLMLTPENLEP